MQRRDFLKQISAPAFALGAADRAGFGYTREKHVKHVAHNESPKLDHVAISTWSLHNYFRSTRDADSTLNGTALVLLDFPEAMADRYKVRRFEVCSRHFASTERAYLQEFKYILSHTRSSVVNLSVSLDESGSDGTSSSPDPAGHRRSVDAVKPWIDVARAVGTKSVSVGPGKIDPEDLAPTIEFYRTVAGYAESKGIRVLVQTDESLGADAPRSVVKLLKSAGDGKLGTLPDLNGYSDDRAPNQRLLFPYASSVCHVRALADVSEGAQPDYDLPRAIAIAKQAGFRGYYSIELDGPGDPYSEIQKTLDELTRCL